MVETDTSRLWWIKNTKGLKAQKQLKFSVKVFSCFCSFRGLLLFREAKLALSVTFEKRAHRSPKIGPLKREAQCSCLTCLILNPPIVSNVK